MRQSPSSINTYFDCPRKYYYKYVMRLSETPNIHALKGRAVHKVIERMFMNRKYINPLDYVKTELDKVWEVSVLDLPKDEEKMHKEDARGILNFFADGYEKKIRTTMMDKKFKDLDHAWNYLRPVMNEIELKDDNIGLLGRIDSIEEDMWGKISLIDYKTSKKYRNHIKEDVIRQVRLYAFLYYLKNNKLPDFIKINFLRYGEIFFFPVTLDHVKLAEKDLKHVKSNTSSVEPGDYPKDIAKHCDWCDFKDECFGKIEEQTKLKKVEKNG